MGKRRTEGKAESDEQEDLEGAGHSGLHAGAGGAARYGGDEGAYGHG